MDLHDWFIFRTRNGRPVLSSRRLLSIIEGLPEEGRYQTALRDGDFSGREYMWAAIVNELRLLRVDQASINGQTMKPTLIESPLQVKVREKEEAERRVVQRTISKQLRGELKKT